MKRKNSLMLFVILLMLLQVMSCIAIVFHNLGSKKGVLNAQNGYSSINKLQSQLISGDRELTETDQIELLRRIKNIFQSTKDISSSLFELGRIILTLLILSMVFEIILFFQLLKCNIEDAHVKN